MLAASNSIAGARERLVKSREADRMVTENDVERDSSDAGEKDKMYN
jgi:hypothetical protein